MKRHINIVENSFEEVRDVNNLLKTLNAFSAQQITTQSPAEYLEKSIPFLKKIFDATHVTIIIPDIPKNIDDESTIDTVTIYEHNIRRRVKFQMKSITAYCLQNPSEFVVNPICGGNHLGNSFGVSSEGSNQSLLPIP